MATRFTDQKIALDTKLSTMGSDAIAWENVNFDAAAQNLYLRPTLIRATSDMQTVEGVQSDSGIYQIDIIAKKDTDIATALAKADEIREHFKLTDVLTENTTELFLRAVSILNLDVEDAYIFLPVQVAWVSYTT